MNIQRTQISQNNTKKLKVGQFTFTVQLQSSRLVIDIYGIKSPGISIYIYGQFIFSKAVRETQW